ncbi:ACP phosphodiesterase [Geomonas sp. RF6]|uniref:acyl carrier protein phosphodiesterase n=1 Tax=Geomonas sp. RF6 TaxID=2897342 RepID=UPI001E6040E8|nr:ACP phosphodiesterase [Geomonas sp. RF6]UFS70996.1 ACP phosphodiesterase [Geomonas sp. RF6]
MNYLFHLYLAGEDPDLIAGGFAGDFVKGPLDRFDPPGMRRGVELHRLVDSFAEREESFRQSRQRIAPHYRLFRSVLVDIFYDHFLSVTWEEWHHEPLPQYLARVRGVLEGKREFLPERLKELMPVVLDELIPSYHRMEGIGKALKRMSARVRRPNPLAGAEEELLLHYRELEGDFRLFLPEAVRYAEGIKARGGM